MKRLQRAIARISLGFNTVSGAAIVIMMLLTCADVVLRLFRHPIPGSYEIVGFLGTVVVSFSLAFTSLEKGHIAVEFLIQRLPRRVQAGVETVTSMVGALLFGLITWQSLIYAGDMRQNGEVSLTLGMPFYPFIYGIAAGAALLSLLLFTESLHLGSRTVKS